MCDELEKKMTARGFFVPGDNVRNRYTGDEFTVYGVGRQYGNATQMYMITRFGKVFFVNSGNMTDFEYVGKSKAVKDVWLREETGGIFHGYPTVVD